MKSDTPFRRLAAALTDIVRPITERCSLGFAHLRLLKETALLEIAKRGVCASYPRSINLNGQEFRIEFEFTKLDKKDGGGWLVSYSNMPGCYAHGSTRHVALKHGEEAVKLWLKHNGSVVHPSSPPSVSPSAPGSKPSAKILQFQKPVHD